MQSLSSSLLSSSNWSCFQNQNELAPRSSARRANIDSRCHTNAVPPVPYSCDCELILSRSTTARLAESGRRASMLRAAGRRTETLRVLGEHFNSSIHFYLLITKKGLNSATCVLRPRKLDAHARGKIHYWRRHVCARQTRHHPKILILLNILIALASLLLRLKGRD